MDWKIELLSVPVTDIDRSKAFYEKLGFHADHDVRVDETMRFVQLTPPGSACSIVLDKDLGGTMEPGSLEGIQVVVASADDALRQLADAGVEARGVEEYPWGRFVFFTDPDGNGWAVQELPPRE
ncbi:catechol 2,3-dioxygenase-like lactoylglutathione lyase family enzyme [Conyzicola lurida]|jgi:catechol 2,3-dioxygenase-like lactoylglutathione lyase family enzyme|uniref:Catechol 2,3-dioxygenase-like lactoylglutathione lyase family enzyme n=1 Tax=Conyzicola lurida TaxID=1172621 RepID=A0A841APK3_9MICO|nr:VOC family protein [Conyzicola lurida]MBB5843691.1 catechol 2,3-dioxygenase-like lactoylglutathione lyase family enzyme [Conyzicola lurida]